MRKLLGDIIPDADKPWHYVKQHTQHKPEWICHKLLTGPGGINCSCCQPKVGSKKWKQKSSQYARRKLNQQLQSMTEE
jgi:hypothetical protein